MGRQISYKPEEMVAATDETGKANDDQFESGIQLIKSMMEHREAIFSTLSEIMQTEKNQNLVNNMGSIYKFLSDLDSKWLSGTLDRISGKIKKIPDTESDISGLMGFLRIIKEPDINAGLKVALSLLSALAPSGKDE